MVEFFRSAKENGRRPNPYLVCCTSVGLIVLFRQHIRARLQYAISATKVVIFVPAVPSWSSVDGFGCDQPGHIVRFCPEAKQTVLLDLEEVEEQKEIEAVGRKETVEEIPSGSESEQEQMEENPLDEVLNSGEAMACENNDEEDEVQFACAAVMRRGYIV
ncbi:hypothetical protein [Parasitella parasitica]|uniref:Uncharacterized protein n=1 Tax=Parasitella parasitica TaxID=35722 RepID=A0A0B7N7W5_9FUNG|nr:hypothetical protein [Parasitella parasitica]